VNLGSGSLSIALRNPILPSHLRSICCAHPLLGTSTVRLLSSVLLAFRKLITLPHTKCLEDSYLDHCIRLRHRETLRHRCNQATSTSTPVRTSSPGPVYIGSRRTSRNHQSSLLLPRKHHIPLILSPWTFIFNQRLHAIKVSIATTLSGSLRSTLLSASTPVRPIWCHRHRLIPAFFLFTEVNKSP
jgi:hypothetical protein